MIALALALIVAQPTNAYWADVCLERDRPNACMARAYCEWRADLCPMVRRALRHGVSDRELARIERIGLARNRRSLCAQETADRREGLIGTAPRPGEEGISESNPTPACRERRRCAAR